MNEGARGGGERKVRKEKKRRRDREEKRGMGWKT